MSSVAYVRVSTCVYKVYVLASPDCVGLLECDMRTDYI